MKLLRTLTYFCLLPAAGPAAEIVLPATALERDGPVTAIYRTVGQATGKGALSVRWEDILGRVVEERRIEVELIDESEIRFPLDLRRAVAMVNTVTARLSLEGVDKSGKPDRREESATVNFVAKPPQRHWGDYEIMMWQPHRAERFATLMTLGINAGQYGGKTRTPPDFLLKNNARWYAENLATDFYAEYHRYRRDRIQNWSYLQAKELYKKNPESKEAFKRNPSFSDPAWQRIIRERLVESARFVSPYRPVFYDLADESGIADLASYWDFDFSDHALAEMREWLRNRYGTLAALNRQWGTAFDKWELVTPDTTREAMRRTDENYSAWADHKEFMDISFAGALRMGADAIRSVDPDAYVGIGGGQMPGWGGYDYSRLTQALNAIEPYDIGSNVEIIRSLNPRMAFVTTAFARGPKEKHRVWYEFLHGARGNVIWDDKQEHILPDGSVGERGKEVAPYFQELRAGLGALLIASARQADPIAIHYSQPSMRTEWMLAQRPKGDAWVNRGSATERRDSDFLRDRESWCKLVEDLGLQYKFVSYGQVESGELKRGYRMLIMPRSSALSAAEVAAIRDFAASGGLVVADGVPGAFDERSRRLREPALAGLYESLSAIDYLQQRLLGKEGPTLAAFQKLAAKAAVRPVYAVSEPDGSAAVGVETHSFRNGGVTIVGLHANPQLRVDELGPPEFRSNERFEKPHAIRLTLPGEMVVFDVRARKALGRTKQLSLTIEPFEPTLLALSPVALPGIQLTAPARVARGEMASVAVRTVDATTPAATHIVHIDVTDPDGKPAPQYSGNLQAPGGTAQRWLPIAQNDKPGKWAIRAHDVLGGGTATAEFEVY